MQKLNICHLITRMIVGGAQENTLLTAIGHIENGNKCVLVTGPSPGPEGKLLQNKKIPPELEIVQCPYLCREINPIKDISAYFWLINFFQSRKFDVVHTHSSKAGIIGRAAAKLASVQLIIHTIHGLPFHKYENPIKNHLYILAERWAAKRCDKIFAVAQAMIEQSINAKIASRDKFKVVYSGMELERFVYNNSRGRIRRELGIASDTLVVGAVARLFPLKGYEDFVPLAAKIAKVIPKVEFIIVGDGVLKEKIEIQAKQLKLKFHFTGLVPPDNVPDYLSAMDLLVHLSLREGLPRATVQALASGIPVVAYELDGAPEVVINAVSGFTIPPRDIDIAAKRAIEILSDSNLRMRLGEEGRKIAIRNFDWKKMAQTIEEEYFMLLNLRS